MEDAKALLLINNKKPQVFKAYILLKKPVSADAYVYTTSRQTSGKGLSL